MKQNGEYTQEEMLNETDAKRICIDDVHIIKLGVIGVQIQKAFGPLRPVDVEWAVTQVHFKSLIKSVLCK